MTKQQLEAWSLQIIDRVKSGYSSVEDDFVELKTLWPDDPNKAARRIAGSANAARGDRVLWLVGVDEKQGIVPGVISEDFSTWWPKILREFESIAPGIMTLNIPYNDVSVTALLFETDRSPYLVRNANFGKVSGENIAWELPWREGTTIRSAKRNEILRLLVPTVQLPDIEICDGSLVVLRSQVPNCPNEKEFQWNLSLGLYLCPPPNIQTVIPFHRSRAVVEIPDYPGGKPFKVDSIAPEGRGMFTSGGYRYLSETMRPTPREIVADGPGYVKLYAKGTSRAIAVDVLPELHVQLYLSVAGTDRLATAQIILPLARKADHMFARFAWQDSLYVPDGYGGVQLASDEIEDE